MASRADGLNLRDLRYVLAVAKHGHIGRAAESCGVSQPTLSVQLRRLEDMLGVALFERTGRGVRPTAICEDLLGHVRTAVAEGDALLAAARALRDPMAGRFRLGIIPTLAPYLLPLILEPLRAALPAVTIEPWEDQTAALLPRLREHALDAILLATEPDGTDLASRPLFDEAFSAALPPGHALATRDAVDEADLGPDLLVLADGHCLRDQTLAACRQGAAPDGPFRATSLATLLNMVAAGYGTTLVPALACRAAEDAGLTLRPLRSTAHRTIRLVWRSRFPRVSLTEMFARTVQRTVQPGENGCAYNLPYRPSHAR